MMALTPEDLDAIRAVVAELLDASVVLPNVPVADPEPAIDVTAETAAAAAAAAERERWDAMPADELARAESAARIQRWVDARDDLTERKASLDLLADVEAGMTPDEIKEAKGRAGA